MKERPILFSAPMVRALLDGSKTQTRRVVKSQPLPNNRGKFDFTTFTDDEGIEPFWQNGQFWVSRCPYGQPGDRLYVRETFFAYGRWETRYSKKKHRDEWHFIDMTLECDRAYQYAADSPDVPLAKGRSAMPGWWKRPAIHMPRAVSRIFRDVVSVRVERLNDISEADAKAEGVMQLDAGESARPEERTKDGWKLCPTCAGTGLHSALGAGGGVIFDVDCRDCDTHEKLYRNLWESINGPGSWSANPWVWCVEFPRVQP